MVTNALRHNIPPMALATVQMLGSVVFCRKSCSTMENTALFHISVCAYHSSLLVGEGSNAAKMIRRDYCRSYRLFAACSEGTRLEYVRCRGRSAF